MHDLSYDKERVQILLDEFMDLVEQYETAVSEGAPFSVLKPLRMRMKEIHKEVEDLRGEK